MTVMVIVGLLMTMIVAIILPMMRSQNRTQAKLDTVQSAAVALYRLQRDLRQTYYDGTWACTIGSSASCSQPTTFGTTTAIAFPTAYKNGIGQFQLQTGVSTAGQPNWQGVMVYWIDSAGDLRWAFDPTPTGFTDEHVNSTTAAKAVADATTGVVTGTEIAANVQQLAVAIDLTKPNMISLKMQAQSTENGSVNKTNYRSDVLARNN
jgi:type II secretory pathway pseudopilin PulG